MQVNFYAQLNKKVDKISQKRQKGGSYFSNQAYQMGKNVSLSAALFLSLHPLNPVIYESKSKTINLWTIRHFKMKTFFSVHLNKRFEWTIAREGSAL